VRARLFLRAFLIQGLWNYRTLLGAGFAWVLLPVLRARSAGQPAGGSDGGDGVPARLVRLCEPFNAHPYLAGFAVGAVARMELDGEPPEAVGRFRDAMRGPLGALGDGLVWAAWLPSCVLAAVVAWRLGAHPAGALIGFLLLFNALHLLLRWWGVAAGLAQGKGVAASLARLRIPTWTERVGRAGVLLLGLLAGTFAGEVLLSGDVAFESRWTAAALPGMIVLFVAGLVEDRGLARWAPALFVFILAGLFLAGAAA
jgi:mannose PTS system EIID component